MAMASGIREYNAAASLELQPQLADLHAMITRAFPREKQVMRHGMPHYVTGLAKRY